MALHQDPELMRADPAGVLDGLDPGVDPNMPSGDLQVLLGSMLKSGDEQISLSQLLMDQKMSFDINSQSLSLSVLDEGMGMAISHSGALGLPSVPTHSIAAGLNTIDLRDIAIPSEDSMADLEEVLNQNVMIVDKYPHGGIAGAGMMGEEKRATRDMIQHELELQRRKQEHDLLMRQQVEMERHKQQQLQQQLQQQQLHQQQAQQLAQQQTIAQATATALSEPTLTVVNQPYPVSSVVGSVRW